MPLDSFVAPLAAFLAPTGPLAPAAPLAPAQYHAQGVVRTVLHAGFRTLDDDFDPAEEQTVLGISMDVRGAGGNGSFEAGYFYSSGDGDTRAGANSIDVESLVHEVWMGGRWAFDPWDSPIRPYAGAGLSILRAEFSTEGLGGSDSNSGWAAGVYGHGGVEWDFGGGWAVGLDLRVLYSTPAALQEEVPLDYVQAGLTLSWTW